MTSCVFLLVFKILKSLQCKIHNASLFSQTVFWEITYLSGIPSTSRRVQKSVFENEISTIQCGSSTDLISNYLHFQ